MKNTLISCGLLFSLPATAAVLGLASGLTTIAIPVSAQCIGLLCTLEDRNSTVKIDLSSQQGLLLWEINSVNQIAQEWFWYRLGDSGPEAPLDTLAMTDFQANNTNSSIDNKFDTLTALWTGSTFDIRVQWSLRGAGLDQQGVKISERISITNTSPKDVVFYFFEYTDFDLGGSGDDDFAVMESINQFWQFDELTAATVSWDVAKATEVRYEIAPFPVLLDSLNDNSTTTLANAPQLGTVSGPGDLPFAWQWQFVIAPREAVTIQKSKQLQSTPTTEGSAIPALLSLGLLGSALDSRKKRSSLQSGGEKDKSSQFGVKD